MSIVRDDRFLLLPLLLVKDHLDLSSRRDHVCLLAKCNQPITKLVNQIFGFVCLLKVFSVCFFLL